MLHAMDTNKTSQNYVDNQWKLRFNDLYGVSLSLTHVTFKRKLKLFLKKNFNVKHIYAELITISTSVIFR